eukprot:m.201966 g.201966  ORF g.201966 m.201966 type:complete len:603 (-) comp18808_c1_seq1:79-1887(-)
MQQLALEYIALTDPTSTMGKRRSSQAIKRNGNAGGSKGTKEEVKARIQAIKEGKDIQLVTNDQVPKTKRKPRPPVLPPDDGIVFASSKPKKQSAASGAASSGAKTPKLESVASATASADSGTTGAVTSTAKGDDDGGFKLYPPDTEDSEKKEVVAIDSGYDMQRWTGKSPETSLRDLCRSNKWKNPNFRIYSRGETACACRVSITRIDPKTKDPASRSYFDNRVYVDAFQAKQFAAVFTLHKINWDKPMHRVLPPGYKDYWYDLDKEFQAKRAALKDRGQELFAAPDPFGLTVASREHEKTVERQKKERARKARMGDQQLPVVRLSPALRAIVESAAVAVGSGTASSDGAATATGSGSEEPDARKGIINAIRALGFLETHIREALEYVSTREECLDWLCMHVPERDLPTKFQPTPIRLEGAKFDQVALSRHYKIERLLARGFGRQECDAAMKSAGDSEYRALCTLIDDLCADAGAPTEPMSPDDDVDELRLGERDALDAIYDADVSVVDDVTHLVYTFRIKCEGVKVPCTLEAAIAKDSDYPFVPPRVLVTYSEIHWLMYPYVRARVSSCVCVLWDVISSNTSGCRRCLTHVFAGSKLHSLS